jgi:hypothetical protein
MPKTLINRILLAVMAIVSLVIIIDAIGNGPTQQLIIGLLCLAVTVVVAPALRRAEQKKNQDQLK